MSICSDNRKTSKLLFQKYKRHVEFCKCLLYAVQNVLYVDLLSKHERQDMNPPVALHETGNKAVCQRVTGYTSLRLYRLVHKN
jgi:hypothetical protein